jgi:hypothetical protein
MKDTSSDTGMTLKLVPDTSPRLRWRTGWRDGHETYRARFMGLDYEVCWLPEGGWGWSEWASDTQAENFKSPSRAMKCAEDDCAQKLAAALAATRRP